MNILGILFIGLLVGVIARLLMPGKDPGGWIVAIVLGVAGSFVGGFVGRALGWYQEGESAGFVMSVVGAMLLLFFWRLATGRRHGTVKR